MKSIDKTLPFSDRTSPPVQSRLETSHATTLGTDTVSIPVTGSADRQPVLRLDRSYESSSEQRSHDRRDRGDRERETRVQDHVGGIRQPFPSPSFHPGAKASPKRGCLPSFLSSFLPPRWKPGTQHTERILELFAILIRDEPPARGTDGTRRTIGHDRGRLFASDVDSLRFGVLVEYPFT